MVKPELIKRAALIRALADDLNWMTSQTIADETPEDHCDLSKMPRSPHGDSSYGSDDLSGSTGPKHDKWSVLR